MADVLLFHHAQGLTPGVLAFADELRQTGHTVHAPDLYAGRTFEQLADGITHADEIDLEQIYERGRRVADDLPAELVYAGFSLGVVPAQKLAQTRTGAKGALLFHSAVRLEFFGPWPDGVPVQIHSMDADPIFTGEGDLEAARGIVAAASDGALFMYPGDQHLFLDSSMPSYDAEAAALARQRVLDFLATI